MLRIQSRIKPRPPFPRSLRALADDPYEHPHLHARALLYVSVHHASDLHDAGCRCRISLDGPRGSGG
jgi:hypothetical protein